MGRCSVLQAVEQEAELFIGFFIGNTQGFKYGALHGRVVDTDGTATQLRAVEHHVIGPRQRFCRVALELFRATAGHGEGVMQGVILPFVFLEHGEVHYPQRCPLAFDQVQVVADFNAQGAQGLVDDLGLVGTEEDQVAGLGAGALKDALDGILSEEFQDR